LDPDGLHFVYATNRDGANEIWLRNRQDGSERNDRKCERFSDGKSDGFLDCVISPDGSRVAYRRFADESRDLDFPRLPEIPSAAVQRSTQHISEGASWSPMAIGSPTIPTYNGKPAVLKIRVGANHEPELVAYAADLNPVRWSPRGDWIAWNDGHKLALASPDGKQKRTVEREAMA